MQFQRYAIYYMPAGDALAKFGATWLGWDPIAGKAVDHPKLAGLPRPITEITDTPRKYGLHATIKPPFRLAPGVTAEALDRAARAFCATQARVMLDGLQISQLGRFLALTPMGDQSALNALAADTVQTLDPFRAPPSEAELAKRRANGLSPAQDALLLKWGYPYVIDEFRFHITLSGKLPKAEGPQVASALAPHLTPLLPQPFVIDSLALAGEDSDGRFHVIQRYALSAES